MSKAKYIAITVNSIGNLGNAGTVTTNANLTGDVTSVGNGTTLATVTQGATGSFVKVTLDTKGRVTGNVAVAQADITGLLGASSISNTMLANGSVANLSGTNTGNETSATIKTALGITTLSGSNTGDQTLPVASSTAPAALGVAAIGVGTTFARADHVHLLPTLGTLGAQAAGTYATGTGSASGTNTGDETLATIKTKLGITTLSGSNTGDQTLPTTLPNANAITFTSTGGAVAGSTYTGAAILTVDYATVGAAASGHTHSYQAADADLLAIGGLTGTSGYLKKTAADTWTLDTSTFATGVMPVASSTAPAALGVAAVGTGTTFARADHVHLQPTLATLGAQAAGSYLTSAVTTISGGTTGLTPSTATSGAVTLAGTLAVANGGTGVTTHTGSGNNVLSTSPTLVTPILGTPTSGTLSSCTVDGTDAVGFRNIPQNAQTGTYTLVLTDSGKHIYHALAAAAATYTIPSAASVAYPIGTAITFINMATAAVTIAITTDTMYLSSAGTTGSRTLAQFGSATAIKITSNTWLISGSGLT